MTQSVNSTEGCWLPLIEYSLKKGLSLSTLRRQIKANKVNFKLENGRYLLKDEPVNSTPGPDPCIALKNTIDQLQQELQKAHEEIAELKTLIALYEEKIP
jgi:DNA-binding transcriptional MerR regulator